MTKITYIFFALIFSLGAFWLNGLQSVVDNETAIGENSEKINGVSYVGTRHVTGPDSFIPIKSVHANWVAITPYAFARAGEPSVSFNNRRQWWGERRDGVISTINNAKSHGLKVMLKPHVWVRGQGWAGDFDLETEEDWKIWEQDYADYILSYSRIADSLGVEMIAVGTEYRKAVVKRPQFWTDLISEIRAFYDGKITYAANWDNYENVVFWDKVDFIGVDAYFPVSEEKVPTSEQVKEGWQGLKTELSGFSKKHSKPILFTEFGFRSVDFTADGHWKRDLDQMSPNFEAQVNAYQGIFESVWDENWFAGGFLWKWFPRHEQAGGKNDNRFTPQNKPAEETIRQWFGRYK